jgi:hypothetical protein
MSVLIEKCCDVVDRAAVAGESDVIRRARQLAAAVRGACALWRVDGVAARRGHAMSVIADIVAVELMEQSRSVNPLWVIDFSEIRQLSARP